jgi:proline dehydrogenase
MKNILDGLDPATRDEIVASAVDFMNNPLWKRVTDRVRNFHVERLSQEPVYSLTAVNSHASLQVLDQVVQEIGSVAAQVRMENRRKG